MDQINQVYDDFHLSCIPELVQRARGRSEETDLWELEFLIRSFCGPEIFKLLDAFI